MYQSKNQINEAFIAAVRSLEKIPYQWKLSEYRRRNQLQATNYNLRSKKCFCDDEEKEDIASTSPYFFPIFSAEGENAHGFYSMLPFYYLVYMNNSNAFPLVELIEIPLIHSEIKLNFIEKEKIDEKLVSLGNSHVISSKKITSENLSYELNSIRKKVASKVIDMTNKFATIFFSTFSELDKNISLSDKTGYIAACEENEEKIIWDFQTKRIIPIKYENNLYTFALNSWVLNKSGVS